MQEEWLREQKLWALDPEQRRLEEDTRPMWTYLATDEIEELE